MYSLNCPSCGAPLPPNAARSIVVCGYCGASVSLAQKAVRAESFLRSLHALDADAAKGGARMLGGAPYRILGKIAEGDTSDVFLGERAQRLSERVVVKVVRDDHDADLLQNEIDVLTLLSNSQERGSHHFRRLIPEPIFSGLVELRGRTHPVAVYRYRAGFERTLSDVARVYRSGLDPRHGVWIWRRTLELLGWLHSEGIVHGAPLADHLLLDAAQHGVMLLGFSCAALLESGIPLRGVHSASRPFYPRETLQGRPLDRQTDLTVVARSIRHPLHDATKRDVGKSPDPIAALLDCYADEPASHWPTHDALELSDLVGEAALRVYGRPHFLPLPISAIASP